MRKPLLSIAAASVLMAGVGLAYGQSTTTTTTTWNDDEGTMLRQYSTTRHYNSVEVPSWQPSVGAELPSSVTVYPLPETMRVPAPQRYAYGMVNNNPVVVDKTTRRVVHTWESGD
jgi:hypothetical protein